MKRVKFVSALLSMAALFVVGLSFTSCEEEDLAVSDGNITITTPTATITVEGTDVTTEAGAVFVVISAVDSSTGATLSGVTLTVDGDEYDDEYTETLTESKTYGTITAEKTDYVTATRSNVTTPDAVAGTLTVYPITLYLEANDAEVTTDVETLTASEIAEVLEENVAETTSESYDLAMTAGESYSIVTNTADATPYMTDEQKEEAYEAIEALTESDAVSAGLITRAGESDLETAKSALKDAVDAYASAPNYTVAVTSSITVSEDAASYTVTIVPYVYTTSITFKALVSSKYYSITPKVTITYKSQVTVEAGSTTVSHSHSSHGDSDNSGGGTSSAD